VPLTGACSCVCSRAVFALWTLASALYTDACPDAMLAAEEVVLVEPPPDPAPLPPPAAPVAGADDGLWVADGVVGVDEVVVVDGVGDGVGVVGVVVVGVVVVVVDGVVAGVVVVAALLRRFMLV
jgi:hypothetical protein